MEAKGIELPAFFRKLFRIGSRDRTLFKRFVDLLKDYSETQFLRRDLDKLCCRTEELFKSSAAVSQLLEADVSTLRLWCIEPIVHPLLHILVQFTDHGLSENQAIDAVQKLFSGQLPQSSSVQFRALRNSPNIEELLHELRLPDPPSDASVFDALRTFLLVNSPEGSDYFLECCGALELYAHGVVVKKECLALVSPLFLVTFANRNVTNQLQKRFQALFRALDQVLDSRRQVREASPFYKDFSELSHPDNSYVRPWRLQMKQARPSVHINREYFTIARNTDAQGPQVCCHNASYRVLYHIEDQRLRVDLRIQAAKSLLASLETKQALKPFHLTSLRFLYGDRACRVQRLLHERPGNTVPNVIRKAKQEIRACMRIKSSNKSWDEEVKKHYYKSFVSTQRRSQPDTMLLAEAWRLWSRHVDSPQFQLAFAEFDVLFDALRLLLLYAPAQPEAAPIEQFLCLLFEDVLHVPLPEDIRWNTEAKKECWGAKELDELELTQVILNRWVFNSEHIPLEVHLPLKRFQILKPLQLRGPFKKFVPVADTTASIIYGTESLYIFFHWLHVVYTRLLRLKPTSQYSQVLELMSAENWKSSHYMKLLNSSLNDLCSEFNALRYDKALLALLQYPLSQNIVDEQAYYTEAIRAKLLRPLFRFHWAKRTLSIHLVQQDPPTGWVWTNAEDEESDHSSLEARLKLYRNQTAPSAVSLANSLLVNSQKTPMKYVPNKEDIMFRHEKRQKHGVSSAIASSILHFASWLNSER